MNHGEKSYSSASNTGGMDYISYKISDYYQKFTNCGLQYKAMANYTGDEDKLPTSITVSIKSCDEVLNETVVIPNEVEGYTIDYKNGTYSKD